MMEATSLSCGRQTFRVGTPFSRGCSPAASTMVFGRRSRKKRRMFEVRLCRNKIMAVHVRRIVYQSGERRKSADGRYGDKFFQNGLQAQCCQRILFYDCYFRNMLHLGYRLCFSHWFIDSCWRNAISKKRLKKAFSFSKTVFISHFYSFSFGNGSVFVCCTCSFIYRFIMCSVQLRPQCGRN